MIQYISKTDILFKTVIFLFSLLSLLQSWCHDNYIHARNMSTVQDIRKQLKEICRQNSLQLTSNNDGERLRKTLLCGFFRNVAEHVRDGKYLTVSVLYLFIILVVVYHSCCCLSFCCCLGVVKAGGVHPSRLLLVFSDTSSSICNVH